MGNAYEDSLSGYQENSANKSNFFFFSFPKWNRLRSNFRDANTGDSYSKVGMLRLRRSSASLHSGSAQHDSVLGGAHGTALDRIDGGSTLFLNCSVAFCFVLKSVFEDLWRSALFRE